MKTDITSFDQLPITLRAEQVAAVLGISRSNAYALMRQEDFPTLHIGKRMLVPKDRLIQWIICIKENVSRKPIVALFFTNSFNPFPLDNYWGKTTNIHSPLNQVCYGRTFLSFAE